MTLTMMAHTGSISERDGIVDAISVGVSLFRADIKPVLVAMLDVVESKERANKSLLTRFHEMSIYSFLASLMHLLIYQTLQHSTVNCSP